MQSVPFADRSHVKPHDVSQGGTVHVNSYDLKGSLWLSMCPRSQTFPETKLPVDLPWAANAVYLSDRDIQTLEREACRQLSTGIENNTSSSSPWLPPR